MAAWLCGTLTKLFDLLLPTIFILDAHSQYMYLSLCLGFLRLDPLVTATGARNPINALEPIFMLSRRGYLVATYATCTARSKHIRPPLTVHSHSPESHPFRAPGQSQSWRPSYLLIGNFLSGLNSSQGS